MTQYIRISGKNGVWLVTLLLFGAIHLSHAQKEPQYTQYMYNIGSFNPAYVGSVETTDISALYRAQWIDIEGAPRTIRFGVNHPFNNETMGLGFNVINDQIGPSTQTFVDVAYSYQVNLSDYVKLSFGMDVGGSFLNVDFSKGTFENPGEPILDQETISKFYPTVGAGLFMYGDDGYLGVSVPNFLTDDIYNEEVATIVDDKLQFNFIGGYIFELSESLKFKPAVLANYLSGSPVTFNVSTNFLINDTFTAGASYRIGSAVSGLAGFQVSPNAFIGYSYDYTTNSIGDYSQGSHEIIVKFFLGKDFAKNKKEKMKGEKGKPKQIDSPRFF
ncbi:type IX secretion system membrane protein PorP/SprF [Zeaxanthinibacter enoshimensis]|uniref:PorP/SprF family type IX secretion system membrane protein n=1 Tax=Zeaxanthinibacter enoshimensis TaxID=392009 RepID=UPI0035614E23